MDKYRVSLTPQERADLERMVSAGKAAARKLTHARILLLADVALQQQRLDDDIVAALGVGPRTISRVRQRFVTTTSGACQTRWSRPHHLSGPATLRHPGLRCRFGP